MSNSPLINCTILSPNYRERTAVIDTITIHCMAGTGTVEDCGRIFASPSRKASSNYGIDSSGKIALYVPEDCRSICTNSTKNDNRAVTIEVANTVAEHPWPVSDAAYASLIELCADICRRNGIKRLLWQGDKSLIGQVDKQNMTVHRWFAAKACPGDYLYERHGDIARLVNERLEAEEMERYERLSDIPNDWGARDIINDLMDAGIIKGRGDDPHGNNDVIDLSLDMVRLLTFNYRGGCYDRALIAAGLKPVVGNG